MSEEKKEKRKKRSHPRIAHAHSGMGPKSRLPSGMMGPRMMGPHMMGSGIMRSHMKGLHKLQYRFATMPIETEVEILEKVKKRLEAILTNVNGRLEKLKK